MIPDLVGSLSHVAFRVRDLAANQAAAETLIGLVERERDDECVYLTHGTSHHSLKLIAAGEDRLDHVAFETTGPEALAELRERIVEAGYEIVETSLDGPLDDGFCFLGPEGLVVELHTVAAVLEAPPGSVVAPNRIGHFNVNPAEVEPMHRLFTEVLGFRVSDEVGDGLGYFLRCNSDHHAVAILPGRGVFHHLAWEVKEFANLMRVADLLAERGERTLWGPLRHGAGHNVAVYFTDPAGSVVEIYTDMDRIESSEASTVHWDPEDTHWYSLWTDYRPPGLRELGLPIAVPAAR
jgi:catechol 2,3-dioxygenase